jgi:antitoxin component of MazEF toxin-antitoxin module
MDHNGKPDDGSEDESKEIASPWLKYTLEELLAQITQENLHSEFDFGEPQGKEM